MKKSLKSNKLQDLTGPIWLTAYFTALWSCTTATVPEKPVNPVISPEQQVKAETPLALQNAKGNGESGKIQPQNFGSVYTEVITPDLALRDKHLNDFVGHLLLGNQKVQLVINGVRADRGREPFEPLVVAMFLWSPEGWQKEGGGLTIDVAITGPRRGSSFYVAGFATASTATEATLILALKATDGGAKAEITATIGADASAFTFLFSDFLNPRSPLAAKGQWSLMLSNLERDAFTIPAGEAAPTDRYVRGLLVPTQSGGAAIVPLGYALATEPASDQLILAAEPGLIPVRPGFELHLGPKAPQDLSQRLLALDHCARTRSKTEWLKAQTGQGLFTSLISKCQELAEKSYIVLKAPKVSGPLTPQYPRLVSIKSGAGRLLTQIPLRPEEDVRIAVPPHTVHAVESVPPIGEPFLVQPLDPGTAADVSLPERRDTLVSINPGNDEAPAYLTGFTRLTSGQAPLPPGVLSPSSGPRQSLLVGAPWPAKVLVPAGTYDLVLYRGRMGAFCRASVTPDAAIEQVTCPPQDTASAPEDDHWRLDLATGTPRGDARGQKALTGADITAAPAGESATSPQEIGLIEARAEGHWETLRLYPVDEGILSTWRQWDKQGQSHLVRLAEFKRRFATDRILEISCPPSWVPRDEYQRLLIKYDVDAAQIIGCGSTRREEELLGAAAALPSVHSSVQPTVAPALAAQPGRSFHTAALTLPRTSEIKGATDGLAKALKAGELHPSFGAVVLWSVGDAPLKDGPIPGVLKVRALRGVALTRIEVSTNKGILLRQAQGSQEAELRLTLRPKPGTDWYRIAIFGSPEPGKAEQIVATTGYRRVRPPYDDDASGF